MRPYGLFPEGLFRRGDLNDLTGQIVEGAVIDAQGVGGLGVDGDDAAVHDVVFRHGAGLEDIEGHVGGVGAKLGVVDAAGGERAGRDEAVRAGIEWDAALGQCLGDCGGSGHDDVIGRGKDGVDLPHHAGRGGHDLIVGVACLFDVGNALGIEVSLGFGNGGRGVGFRVGVEQADGLDVRLDGKHHIHDGLGVQRVGSAGDVVDIGQIRGGGVRDGGVDDRGLGALSSGGHALGSQRCNGDDGVVAVRDDLGADLVQRRGVVLAVEVLVLNGDALLGGLGVQLGLDGGADLVQAGVVELLHHGDLVALGVGSGFSGGALGGDGGVGGNGGGGGISGGTTGGQAGHHSGSGQNSNELFHGKLSFICKTGNVVVAGAVIDRLRANRSADSFYKFRLAIALSSGLSSCFPLPSKLKNKTALAQNFSCARADKTNLWCHLACRA